ncbi:MAG: patatin-like phospholipase family protein [Gammaproteobacteria bacterium]|nr:patatin-like phospholipase family protein [Gammaproteobacteria bacterium]
MISNFRSDRLPALLALGIILSASVATAAETEPSDAPADIGRPRVGLVLGGGGARGAAHVGVLKELERMRVPVDAIAGTSMGAAIGGLYAAGMSATELETLVASIDWVSVLSDTSARSELSFRRKQDDEQYPVKLELGVHDGELLLPKGVIQGHKLGLLLRELTFDVADIEDFDDLPTPFRAISSDIEHGEAYVIRRGSLASAIRASMSVPGVIAPVRLDGRLLADGGLVGNLPIDVMQAMNVDVIVAVDVEFPLYTIDQLDSVVAISEQMLTILIRKDTLRQIERLTDDDILIRPELGIFGSSDFGRILETIAPGVQAARQNATRLQQLALDEQAYSAYVNRRSQPRREPETLAFVRVLHDGRLADDVFRNRLNSRPGQPIDPTRLAADADRLYALNLYEQVSYRLVEENGATGVEFRGRSKSWGPNFLQFGISLEDDFEGSTGFNLAARLTRASVNRFGAEWRTDLQLGTDPFLFSEFYQPLGTRSPMFLAPRITLSQTDINAFAMDEAIARLRITEAELGLDLGAELGSVGELRVGAYRGAGEARVKVGDPALPNIDFDTGGVFARLRFDTLDDARFPRKGLRADLRWNVSRPGFGADNNFDTIESEFAQTWSRGKNSVQLGLSYATTLESDNTIQDFFPLGGFLRLSGLDRGEISGPHAALAKLVMYRRVGESAGGLFDIPIYVGLSAEAGNVWQQRSDMSLDSMRLGGSLYAGFDTYIGPVYLAAGFAEGGSRNFYLFIGSPPR